MSEIGVWAGLVSAGVSLLGLQTAAFLVGPRLALPFPGVYVSRLPLLLRVPVR